MLNQLIVDKIVLESGESSVETQEQDIASHKMKTTALHMIENPLCSFETNAEFCSNDYNTVQNTIKQRRREKMLRKQKHVSHLISASCIIWTVTLAACPISSALSTRSSSSIGTNYPTPYSSVNSKNVLKLLNTARKLRVERNGANRGEENIGPSTKSTSSAWKNLFNEDLSNDSIHAALLERQDSIISSRVEAQLDSVKSFRTSLGSEVPDMELYLQMEAARKRARGDTSAAALAFMDVHHGHDENDESSFHVKGNVHDMTRQKSTSARISAVEKVAMSSLPSQLPNLATKVLSRTANGVVSESLEGTRSKQKKEVSSLVSKGSTLDKNKGQKKNFHTVTKFPSDEISTIMAQRKGLQSRVQKEINASDEDKEEVILDESSSPSVRLSHEQEIQLARIIQKGVELHNIKSKFEEEHGRDISKKEWTELAKLESPKELRRIVSNYRQAKSKIVMANMGLVHAVVRSRLGASSISTFSGGGTSYEELVQEGSLGLLRAAELFDPSRGLRFSTYATIWIKGVLGKNNIHETIKLPAREKSKWNKINSAIQELILAHGDNDDSYKPTEEEIAKKCDMRSVEVIEVITKMKRAKNVLSLDYQYNTQSRSGAETGTFDALANDKNLMDDVDLVERLHVRADVIAALARNLDPREARLVRLRYGLNDGRTRTISECAESMGISRTLAQQLSVGCLKKLREADDAQSLQEYLLSIA
jgi:RNA polymerase primary sigma factor